MVTKSVLDHKFTGMALAGFATRRHWSVGCKLTASSAQNTRKLSTCAIKMKYPS